MDRILFVFERKKVEQNLKYGIKKKSFYVDFSEM